MNPTFVPGWVVVTVDGGLIAAVVALSTALANTRERLARVEENLRLTQSEGGPDDDRHDA